MKGWAVTGRFSDTGVWSASGKLLPQCQRSRPETDDALPTRFRNFNGMMRRIRRPTNGSCGRMNHLAEPGPSEWAMAVPERELPDLDIWL